MLFLLISFVSGVLTVLAPCILPVLPIIIGGTVQGGAKRNPYLITGSLALSIVAFTLILKVSTIFIEIPAQVWTLISGGIIIFFGLTALFPSYWTRLSQKFGWQNGSDKLMESSTKVRGRWSDVLLGAALGPVFSSCSPTYFIILATILPASFILGTVYLAVYSLGLSLTLLGISLLGQKFIVRIRFAADPDGWFKKSLGILFILVGVLIISGGDKKFQTFILDSGYFNITNVEQKIIQSLEPEKKPEIKFNFDDKANYPNYVEIVNPSGFINTEGIKLADLIGKKVILVDFMTYTCINCIRTFPYLNDWYSKYKDQGLEIVGIHTPEFAFEKDLDNVKEAMKKYGIEFPVVLDNDYGTWGAYQNQYWPRKYLIDLNGKIVYDHIGEGKYEETENVIRALLGLDKTTREENPTSSITSQNQRISSETYFGSARSSISDPLTLSGEWRIEPEFAQALNSDSEIGFVFEAGQVFFVASADFPANLEILVDGKPLLPENAGEDINFIDGKSKVTISEERLYSLIKDISLGRHTLEIKSNQQFKAYTFTFGS